MNSSLYVATTGMKAHTEGLSVVSHNIANVNTVAFKKQSVVFQDLMYADLAMGNAYGQVSNQKGYGVDNGTVRTHFKEGSFEVASSVTDLALSGKGFFQVTMGDTTHYTRAGNFAFNAEGYLQDAAGYNLTGIKYVNGQESAGLTEVKLDIGSVGFTTSDPNATTAVTNIFNVGFTENYYENDNNPAFSLLSLWDGTSEPPLSSDAYGYAQNVRVYDASGNIINATMYVDSTSLGSNGQSVYEYVLAIDPSQDGSAAAGTSGAGLLMAGTLTFSSNGELVDMSSFTPKGGDYKDLNNWTPAPLVDGYPQVNISTAKGSNVSFTMNMGLASGSNSWSNSIASAAAVGLDASNLPSLGSAVRGERVTTSQGSSSSSQHYSQDGYGVGSLSGLNITDDGLVVASYTNGQSETLYRIPVFRFTSEDGLYHEGNNHFSWTSDAGNMEYGVAGSENYGSILSNTLETSNVDLSSEMTRMIIYQRGFQMNSKTVTTADTMLQKAMELKRS